MQGKWLYIVPSLPLSLTRTQPWEFFVGLFLFLGGTATCQRFGVMGVLIPRFPEPGFE
jgi:hypothetical protein